MSSFSLKLGFCPSETDFKISISKEDWESIRKESYDSGSNQCIGCGYSPENHFELDCHIEYCVLGNKDSAVIKLLCRACHAIRHFDTAVEQGWVTLVNSVHSQEKLVEICREGRHALMSEIDANNIIILKNKQAKQYAIDLKSGEERPNDKIKVIFGKNFDWSIKKTNNEQPESVSSNEETV